MAPSPRTIVRNSSARRPDGQRGAGTGCGSWSTSLVGSAGRRRPMIAWRAYPRTVADPQRPPAPCRGLPRLVRSADDRPPAHRRAGRASNSGSTGSTSPSRRRRSARTTRPSARSTTGWTSSSGSTADRDDLAVGSTPQSLLADIADGYDVVVLGADKWHQVLDPDWYGGPADRDGPSAVSRRSPSPPGRHGRCPERPTTPAGCHPRRRRGGRARPPIPAHHPVSATAVRGGRHDWRARSPTLNPAAGRRDSGPLAPAGCRRERPWPSTHRRTSNRPFPLLRRQRGRGARSRSSWWPPS